MYNCQKCFEKTVQLFIYSAVGIQFILGIIWLATNVTVYETNIISENYIQASKSLVVDDYMGILYALFLRSFSFALRENGIGVSLVYLLQLLFVCSSVFLTVTALCEDKLSLQKKIIISLFITFNPVVLQICCQIDRTALVVFSSLIFLSGAYSCLKGRNRINTIYLFVSSVSLVFLNVEISYFFVIAILICFIVKIKDDKKTATVLLLVSLVMIACVVINSAIVVPYAYQRGQRSFGAVLLQRFAWPNMRDFNGYINLTYGVILENESLEACRSMEGLYSKYMYAFEMKVGYTNATECYKYWAATAFRIDTKNQILLIVRDMGLNMIGVFAIPVIYFAGLSYTLLSNTLSSFTCSWYKGASAFFVFNISFLMMITLLFLIKFVKDKKLKKDYHLLALVVGIDVLNSLYNTIFAYRGYDYRNVVFPLCVYYVFVLSYLMSDRKR